MSLQLLEETVAGFLDRLASAEPTPGGGSASALAGATAAALVSMVCHLTLGRERFRAVEAQVASILERAEAARIRLQEAIERDAAAYAGVMAAYRLPRGSDDERARRAGLIREASRRAAEVPLTIAEDAEVVLALAEQCLGTTNPNAASDVVVAAVLARAAVEGAAANVEINLPAVGDARFAADARERLERIRASLGRRVDAILAASAAGA